MVEISQRLHYFCPRTVAMSNGSARQFGSSLSLAIALLVGLTNSTLAQAEPQTRVTQKVAVQPAVPTRVTKGQTNVALAGGLEQPERGVAQNTLLQPTPLDKTQPQVANEFDARTGK